MAFIYEKLTEKDKEFFSSFEFRDPLSRSSLAKTPINWVSDRERGIYLVCLGGQGYRFDREFPPTFFYLIWEGQLVKIETFDKGEGDWTIGKKIKWKLDRIVASDNLKRKDDLLIKTIIEAFESYEKGRNKNIISIDFVEIATPHFMEGDVSNG